MLYRLLAINIDGTLLRSNGRLPKGTKEALDFVKNKDVYVTLVTNRNFPSAKKVAKALKLDSILVTQKGTIVGNKLEDIIYEKRLSEEKTFSLVQVLENFDCNIRLLHERYSLGNRKKLLQGNIVSKAVLNSGDPLYYPMQFVESLGDSLRDNPVAPPKIDVYFTEEEELQRAKQTIVESFVGIDVTVDNQKLEIVPRGASKVKGLQVLGEHLGISLNEMVVIGDSYDDLDMIEQAGLGVAMGNAPKEIKKAADWVTRSNNQQGVIYMIKEHFRKQQRIEFLKQIKIEK